MLKNFVVIVGAGHRDNSTFMHTTAGLSERNLQRIRKTRKNGGDRLDWADTDLQLKTYEKRDKNSFKDVYGRMSWDKPASIFGNPLCSPIKSLTTGLFSLSGSGKTGSFVTLEATKEKRFLV